MWLVLYTSLQLGTNFMHVQSTYTPHLQYLQLEVHLESSLPSAVKPLCRNSQRVKAVIIFAEELHRVSFKDVSQDSKCDPAQ